MYACKEKRAEREYAFLMNYLKENANGKGANTGSRASARLLERSESIKRNRTIHSGSPMGRKSNARNDFVHSRNEGHKPSNALRDCFRNIEEIQLNNELNRVKHDPYTQNQARRRRNENYLYVEAISDAAKEMRKAGEQAQALFNQWADAFSTALENSTTGQTDVDGYVQLQARKKVSETVDAAIARRGQLGVKYNQEQISKVPREIADFVLGASKGKIDIRGKSIALSGSDLWHEFKRHSDPEVEKGRKQIAFTAESFKEAIMAIYFPDVVESVFSDTRNPTQRQSFAYAKKTTDGHYIVVEAVGGKTNPNIIPVMVLQFTSEKWQNMISFGLTLGEVIYENDTKLRNAIDVEFNKKNRVIVAQFASKKAIANTPHSPQFDDTIPRKIESVKNENEQLSARRRRNENYLDVESRFGVAESVLKYADTLEDTAIENRNQLRNKKTKPQFPAALLIEIS